MCNSRTLCIVKIYYGVKKEKYQSDNNHGGIAQECAITHLTHIDETLNFIEGDAEGTQYWGP